MLFIEIKPCLFLKSFEIETCPTSDQVACFLGDNLFKLLVMKE